MKIYNSMTNQKEEFIPIKENEVSIYVCGPTVYNHVHIGNTRPMIVFDVLRRVFLYKGYNVIFAANFTDVDDKIIKAAKEEGITEKELTEKYINAYNDIRRNLNILMPDFTPRVTDTMERIIGFIDSLVQDGYAYEVDGDVYFRVAKVEEYGNLSGQNIDDLVVGARIDENSKKENPLDFTLWKATDEGIKWETKWSEGRPGWHTECVVMIDDIFHSQIDIHGGGLDLKFPHHENEIAQSKAHDHHALAKYWMHNQMINLKGEKMSKSLGNVVWAKDLIEQLGTNVYKWIMLSTHYRNTVNYTDELVEGVKKEVNKVDNIVKQASLYLQTNDRKLDEMYDKNKVDKMVEYLEDDLNTSMALTLILEEVKELNQLLRVKEKNNELIEVEFATLLKMQDVLGFKFEYKVLSLEDKSLYLKWNEAKGNKEFDKADEYRNELIERGII